MQRTSRKSAWPGRAILLLWAVTVAGFAGAAWWPLDLLSSFRPHYAFAFLAAALLLLVMRRWALAGLALAGLALNAFVVAAPMDAVQASSPPETGMERSLRLLTLNVWFRNRDLDRVVRYLAAADADVIVLQEVDADAALALAGQLPSHPYAFVDAARVRHGAAVLSRHRIVAGEAVQLVPEGVTVAQVRVDVDGQPVTVIGAHLHW
ncbi:MAG TPA: endonuclease/exonuclease/phosphatase family protein, partial [Steroidobacteraceae bacterium]|nr:endonuclease/exonuclease/phosphatase family protein [Steroidobacteraceae bacterium]